MIRGIKLRKLLEQAMTTGLVPPGAPQGTAPEKGPAAYRRHLRHVLGLSENFQTGEPCIDMAARAVNAKEFDLAEVAREMLPEQFRGKNIRHAFSGGMQMRGMQEAEGHMVGASHFAHISAFSDTVGGLIDAMIFEGYQSPEFIGDDLFETKAARVQGGYAIGVRNDGKVSDNPTLGEAYPTVGLSETRVHIPDNIRNGVVLQIREDAFIYDRTDQIQQAAANAGESVRRAKEIRQADCALGRTNTYSRDGVTSNTYRTDSTTGSAATKSTENGTYPMAYTNAQSTLTLTDWQQWNVAKQVLSRNVDPATGWEISVRPDRSVLLVSPDNELLTRSIVHATGIQTRSTSPVATQATAIQLNVRDSANPLAEYGISIKSSRIWLNRLKLAGTNAASGYTGCLNAATALTDSATQAQTAWLWGEFTRAMKYRQIIPFETFQAPLSSEDSRRDIVAVYVSREWGVPWVMEPRYVFFGVGTYS